MLAFGSSTPVVVDQAGKRNATILVKTILLKASCNVLSKLLWQMLADLVHAVRELCETCYKLLAQTATYIQALIGNNWANFRLHNSYIKVSSLYQDFTAEWTVSCQSQLRLQICIRFSQASKRILRLVHVC